jgi:hypothetical protein
MILICISSMDEKCNNCYDLSYQWNLWYHNIFILVVAILLICGMIYFPYEIANRSSENPMDASNGGLAVGFALSVFGFIGLIWWLVKKYIANKYLYSMNDIFPHNSVCDQSPLSGTTFSGLAKLGV